MVVVGGHAWTTGARYEICSSSSRGCFYHPNLGPTQAMYGNSRGKGQKLSDMVLSVLAVVGDAEARRPQPVPAQWPLPHLGLESRAAQP